MIKKLINLTRWAVVAAIPIFSLSSCAEMTVVPNYVTPSELSSLNAGMSKEQTRSTLSNLYPHDILAADETGCEIVIYKYKTPAKKTPGSYAKKERGLTEGDKHYIKENNAYLFFKNGYLETVLTGAGQADAFALLENVGDYVAHCELSSGGKGGAGVSSGVGCTDPEALNYDEEAIVDNGKCDYCPCGTFLNKDFNPKRPVSDCNAKCLSIEVVKEEDKGCTNCDIMKQLMDSKANININMSMPAFQQEEKKSLKITPVKPEKDAKAKSKPAPKTKK
jgi:hypothetical protein